MYENHHLFDIGAKCNGAALEEQKASKKGSDGLIHQYYSTMSGNTLPDFLKGEKGPKNINSLAFFMKIVKAEKREFLLLHPHSSALFEGCCSLLLSNLLTIPNPYGKSHKEFLLFAGKVGSSPPNCRKKSRNH